MTRKTGFQSLLLSNGSTCTAYAPAYQTLRKKLLLEIVRKDATEEDMVGRCTR
jgi:hypothetical protein